MAFDAFLKLTGVTGESQKVLHVGEIDLMSFSWGASNSSSVGTIRAHQATTAPTAARTARATSLPVRSGKKSNSPARMAVSAWSRAWPLPRASVGSAV